VDDLAELERRLQELAGLVRQVFDEHERRLGQLEDARPVWGAAAVAQRRRVIARMRERGMSMRQIALGLNVGLSTVQKDLNAVAHIAPDFVIGFNGVRHPATHNGHRPEAP
jgi:DNA-binding NarL/FixJ family response regulator